MAYKIVNDDSLTSVANAIRVQGSISGTLEFPDGFVSAIQNLSPSPTLQTKTKTYTPTTSQQTESVVADSGYDGLDEVDVTVNAIPSQYKDTTDATATADKILQGYTAYANGQKLVGTASGGITPSGTISITQNGTVDVTQYASADVNVSGGGGSSYTLLASEEFNVSTTSTSTRSVGVVNAPEAFSPNAIIYVKIRDKAGRRAGHFLGTDNFLYATSATATPIKISSMSMYDANSTMGASMGNLGVYASGADPSTKNISIMSKYNASGSHTIDGTFVVEVYALKWPGDISPFV